MKILHLLQSRRFSGAENVVCQIINMIGNDSGIESVYCSPDGEIRETLAERGILFAGMKSFSKKEFKRILKEQKPDIVHAHDMAATFLAYRACGKIPFISHVHNNAFDSRRFSVKSIAYYLAARRAKYIFWVSKSAYEGYAFHKAFKEKSSILYNVIDVDALYERKNSDFGNYDYDVAYVGSLLYPKNPQRLIEVIEKVVEKRPQTKVAIIGKGPLEAEIKNLVESKNLERNIDFLGFKSNPLKILSDSKAMIMTSRWEGLPMCALEALALGVPVVSTPTDGLKDLIVKGKNGFLSDDNEELAQHLVAILEDNNIADVLSENAKAMSRVYNDKEKYAARIVACYEEILK